MRIDPETKKVAVLFFASGEIVQLPPIDARWAIENGFATTGPVEMTGPAGRVMCDIFEVSDKKEQGHKIVPEADKQKTDATEPGKQKEPVESESEDVEKDSATKNDTIAGRATRNAGKQRGKIDVSNTTGGDNLAEDWQ